MTSTWDERVATVWATIDTDDAEPALAAVRALVEERPADDPDALFEWASMHDAVGREAEAVPLYRAALEHGLAGERRSQCLIQLASSLRNVGDPRAAVELLRHVPVGAPDGAAARAFLALAQRDAGHPDDALRTALEALAATLPRYRRAVEHYAQALTESAPTDGQTPGGPARSSA